MRKLLFLLFPFIFVSCASVSVSKNKLDRNGNYIDKSFTHTIIVEKSSSLSAFGVMSKEWEELFEDSLIYKAYGKGNSFMSKTEVKQFTCDAIKLLSNIKKKKFAAIVEEKDSINTTYWNQSSKIGTITTNSYTPLEKYDFSCYAIMFDNEELTPLLREVFGKIQIITVK